MDHIIHAGLTKTGSTSIQHFLDTNQQRLLDNGLLYPIKSQSAKDGRDMRLVTLIDQNRTDELKALVADAAAQAKAAGARAIVWPRSITGMIDPEDGAKLVAILREEGEAGDISVVIYFRNWYDRMISLLNQEEKTSNQIFGDSRLDRIADRASKPSALITGWEQLLGEDKVDVRILEIAGKSGLEKNFLEACGFGWDEAYDLTPPMNSSLDPITARVINLLRQEWNLPNVHRRCERVTKAYPLPVTKKRFLDRLIPLVEATDFSHPKLAKHRELLTRLKEQDLSRQPTIEDFLDDLVQSLEVIRDGVAKSGGVSARSGKPARPLATKPGRRKRAAAAG